MSADSAAGDLGEGDLAEGDQYRLVSRTEQFSGGILDVFSDEVTMPGGRVAVRDWIRHPGAVGVVAVSDPNGGDDLDGPVRVLLVRQFRHPVRRVLWELPAGLLDVEGEKAVVTAARELAEEADLLADRYEVLVDLLTTPGCSDEAIRLFLARGVSAVPEADRHVRDGEEATMTTAWVDLDEATSRVLAGEVENAACAAGILAAAAAKARGWRGLRPADAPWRSRAGR